MGNGSALNPAGIDDRELRELAKCGQSKKNECRALHRLIHRTGRSLPVRISEVRTPVRIPGQRRKTNVNFPVLYPTSWARQILSDGGKLLLAGFSIEQEKQYRDVFRTFWSRFYNFRPDLDLYQQSSFDVSTCIPVALHGDEGRGKLRRAIMILSMQPVISYKGPMYTNMSGPHVIKGSTIVSSSIILA